MAARGFGCPKRDHIWEPANITCNRACPPPFFARPACPCSTALKREQPAGRHAPAAPTQEEQNGCSCFSAHARLALLPSAPVQAAPWRPGRKGAWALMQQPCWPAVAPVCWPLMHALARWTPLPLLQHHRIYQGADTQLTGSLARRIIMHVCGQCTARLRQPHCRPVPLRGSRQRAGGSSYCAQGPSCRRAKSLGCLAVLWPPHQAVWCTAHAAVRCAAAAAPPAAGRQASAQAGSSEQHPTCRYVQRPGSSAHAIGGVRM